MSRGHPDWQPWTALQRFSKTGGATPYEQIITIPANTEAGVGEATQKMTLEKGFISHVWLRFPQGPSGLAGVRIYNAADDTQLWPGGADTYFTGDNEIIDFDTEKDIEQDIELDYCVVLHGYNSDDSYEHGILVRIWVVALP